MESISEKIQIQMGIVGCLLIMVFHFLPIPPDEGKYSAEFSTNFYFSGKGEQYGFLTLTLLAALFIYRDILYGAAIALGGIVLCTASAFLRPIIEIRRGHFGYSKYWAGYSGPGFFHWFVLFLGVSLLAISVVVGWQMMYQKRTTIQLRGSTSSKTRNKYSPAIKIPNISRPTMSDIRGSIDWGWWGIVVLSFFVWPLGLLLHFAFSRSGDDKGDAAIIGAGLALGIMVLRFVLAMAKVGGTS